MHSRILHIAAPVIITLGLAAGGTALAAAPALAAAAAPASTAITESGSGYHYYYDSLNLNAWNGGPDVRAYNQSATDDDFTAEGSGSSVHLVDTDGGAYNGDCIGNFGNSSSQDADEAVLEPCSPLPWGADFQEQSCGGGLIAFYDEHDQGYLEDPQQANGTWFVLGGNIACFHVAAA
jgi:hypothetical protein